MTDAPDFAPGYPSKGERIGPAWQRIWDGLDHFDWRPAQQIAKHWAAETGLAVVTIRNMLRDAAKTGHLESDRRPTGKMVKRTIPIRQTWYRRRPE